MSIRTSIRAAAISAALNCVTIPVAFADISGVYILESERSVQMLHLVEMGDGSVKGRLEIYSVQANESARSTVRSVEGVADEDELILFLPGGFSGNDSTLSMSGVVSNGTLQLVWELDGTTMKKSDLSTRDEALERLVSSSSDRFR